MTTLQFALPKKGVKKENRVASLTKFASDLEEVAKHVGFKLSARGWAYQLEGFRLINKDQFDRVETLVNACKAEGYLAVDFVAEEEGRKFSGIEIPDTRTPIEFLKLYLEAPLNCEQYYTPDWWAGETYYIQMVVEKIDLKTLFEPICQEYHIPIATSKGWSSQFMRAEYGRRFKEAEDKGLKAVLLYCGDFDPDGLRISQKLRKNLVDVRGVHWTDGTQGYDPAKLIIDRFGLDFDFIMINNLTWIDNLITGSKKNLADPSHRNYRMPYVQEYLKNYCTDPATGKITPRKCEANALIVNLAQGRKLCRDAIEKYLGVNALNRFQAKTAKVANEIETFRVTTGLKTTIQDAVKQI